MLGRFCNRLGSFRHVACKLASTVLDAVTLWIPVWYTQDVCLAYYIASSLRVPRIWPKSPQARCKDWPDVWSYGNLALDDLERWVFFNEYTLIVEVLETWVGQAYEAICMYKHKSRFIKVQRSWILHAYGLVAVVEMRWQLWGYHAGRWVLQIPLAGQFHEQLILRGRPMPLFPKVAHVSEHVFESAGSFSICGNNWRSVSHFLLTLLLAHIRLLFLTLITHFWSVTANKHWLETFYCRGW